MPSQFHDRLGIMIHDIHFEQVLSMKYLGMYINNRLEMFSVTNCVFMLRAKIAVPSKIRARCRSDKLELLYKNAIHSVSVELLRAQKRWVVTAFCSTIF